MTIRGIAAVYLIFAIFPVIAAIIIFIVAYNKKKKLDQLNNPDPNKKPSRPGRLRRFFTIRKQ